MSDFASLGPGAPGGIGRASGLAVKSALCMWLLAASTLSAAAQTQTVGLFVHDERAGAGYTLFGPQDDTKVYLLSNDGLLVHSWETLREPKSMPYLLPNGDLLRAARSGVGTGIRLQQFDWDGDLLWDFMADNTHFRQHHDIEPLPNGNVLVISREIKSAAEAIDAGRNPLQIDEGTVGPDTVVEIRPIPPNDGEIVWSWHVWDHLVQSFDPTKDNFGVVWDHPELINVNYGPSATDWTHVNGIDHDPELDQIILGSRTFSEIWVVDHSTTTAEAASHAGGNSGKGGDLLYRWGNPAAYGRGMVGDQQLFGQHDATRIPPGYPGAGNILVFNNGWGRPDGAYSSVDEIVPPADGQGGYSIEPGAPFGPDEPVWSYVATPPEDFYSSAISGSERLPEGTTLICEGRSGRFFEVTSDDEVVWDYVNPLGSGVPVAQGDPVPSDNWVFKIRRYAPDHPAFAGRDLTPGDPIEWFDAPLPTPQDFLMVHGATGPGDPIQVEWDASTCTSFDYHLLYGPLANVSAYELSGAECNIGTTGAHSWIDAPAGSLFFLVVGTDDTGVYESSWNRDSSGNQRNGTTASSLCGTTTKIVTSSCP